MGIENANVSPVQTNFIDQQVRKICPVYASADNQPCNHGNISVEKRYENSVEFFEKLLLRSAFRANPVLWEIFERSPDLNVALSISFFRIVDVPTWAFPLVHSNLLKRSSFDC
jgi:hypothetical protein